MALQILGKLRLGGLVEGMCAFAISRGQTHMPNRDHTLEEETCPVVEPGPGGPHLLSVDVGRRLVGLGGLPVA